MNCSRPNMETALVEKLHSTYMLMAMWRKEKWLKQQRIMGVHSVSAGEEEEEDDTREPGRSSISWAYWRRGWT